MSVKNKDTGGNLPLRMLILIFVILAAGILIAGHLFYSNYANNHKTQIEQQLSAIADLKSGELVQWRKERIGDANQLFGNPAFSSLVQRYFEHSDDVGAQEQLRSWLTAFQANYQYARVFLLDTQGIGRIFEPDTAEPVPRHIPQDAQRALQSGRVNILDLDSDEDTPEPHMVVLVPIFREKDGNQPLGVVVMRIDPYQYLYPLINRWPTPSKTAETLIVRRDGNDALYLNELKFQKDTALKLRIPLEQKDVLAVKAALGEQGIVEGRDYRGEQVIADIRQIPDSPWFMVARMDTSEVYAPLTQMLWVVIALVGVLLIGAGAGTGLVWRRQNILVYKERAESAEALIESEARYRDLFENASLAIFRSTLEGKPLTVNPKFASMFGYKSQEEVVATVKHIAAEHYADPHHREEIVRLKQANPDLNKFEVLYRRKDGSTFSGELTLNIITDSDGATLLEGFIEDITERKLSEEKLLKSYESVKKTLNDSINTMVKIVELRDPYTAGHQQKVADLATAIAREMKLEDTRIDQIRMAAVIHDIGKMYVPSDILSKPGKLTDIELGLIKAHSHSGYDIVKSMDLPCSVANTVVQHHERLDGSGYPNQLKAEDTLLESKILAVADVVEAMSSHRPYRPALGIDKALEEISKNKGRLYDPDVVNTCLELFTEKGFKFKE